MGFIHLSIKLASSEVALIIRASTVLEIWTKKKVNSFPTQRVPKIALRYLLIHLHKLDGGERQNNLIEVINRIIVTYSNITYVKAINTCPYKKPRTFQVQVCIKVKTKKGYINILFTFWFTQWFTQWELVTIFPFCSMTTMKIMSVFSLIGAN